jgi:hypothetical protein
MVLSFTEFINESESANFEFLKKLAKHIINKVKDMDRSEDQEYQIIDHSELTDPFLFDLIVYLRRDRNPNFKEDEHFNGLAWELINFQDLGYSIDANTYVNKGDLTVPEIKVHILLDPTKEPLSYNKLFHRVYDLLIHETNHLDQVGVNRDPFNVKPSTQDDRKAAKGSYQYFLLPDEVESMVEGMYGKSEESNTPLDQVFFNYLSPLVKSRFMTTQELAKVMQVWVTHAVQTYPNANFSSKVDDIINNL